MSAQPGQVPTTPQVDPVVGINAMLTAIQRAAEKAAMADSAAEVNDFGKGALAFAQAIITLDPTRLAGGDTPQARAASSSTPPTPVPSGRPPVKDGNHNGVIGA